MSETFANIFHDPSYIDFVECAGIVFFLLFELADSYIFSIFLIKISCIN